MSMSRPKKMSDEDWRERRREQWRRRQVNLTEEQKERNKEHNREQQRRSRANLSEEQREAWRVRVRKENKKFYENRTEEQKERRLKQGRRWRANLTEEQIERRRAVERATRRADPDKYQPRLKSKRARDNLYDSYVRGLLRRYEWGAEPPPELIELKRVQIKIRRYLNQGEQI